MVGTDTLQFAPGSQLEAITIPITDDTITERSEEFIVMLVSLDEEAASINMAMSEVTVTITDNDGMNLCTNVYHKITLSLIIYSC